MDFTAYADTDIPEVVVEEEDDGKLRIVGPRRPTPAMDEGEIIVASSQRQVDETLKRWVSLGVQPIAHDLECAPSNTVWNGTGLHPHLGVMRLAQFAVADNGDGRAEALVVDVWKYSIDSWMRLITDPQWPIIVHYAAMEQRWHGWLYRAPITNTIDTWHASKLAWEADHRHLIEAGEKPPKVSHSLAAVCLRELGVEVDKTYQNSPWDAVKLCEGQLRYAGVDVLSLLDLWPVLAERLDDEAMQKLREKARERAERACAVPQRVEEGLPAPGCESERAIRMIRAARSERELEQVRRALAHMRLHWSRRDEVEAELRRAKRRLRRSGKPKQPVRVKMASWKTPF